MKIMIDPGHAGMLYNAAPDVVGYYESMQMWKLAHKLKEALEEWGIETGMTRYSIYDDPELTERGRKAKGCDLFVSLHSNASGDKATDAPWIITLTPDDKTKIDETSRIVGETIGPVVSGVMGVSAPFYYTKRVDFDRDGNGYLDDEYYGVLFGAKSVGVPGIIIEHSFHTNARAATWLLNEDNLTVLAKAEAAALAELYELGGEKKMTKDERIDFDDLKSRVVKIEADTENSRPKYNWTLACPEYAQSTIHKLTQKKILKGDENGQLNLSEDMCRIFVILDRAGVFDK